MKNSLLSVYKDNNRHGSVQTNYNGDTNLVQTHTHTHTDAHKQSFIVFRSPFSSHVFTAELFTLNLNLQCYLHLKLFLNLNSGDLLFSPHFAKTLKTLNTREARSPPHTHTHTHTHTHAHTHTHTHTHKNSAQVYKHFVEHSVCGLFHRVVVRLSQRYALSYLCVPRADSGWYGTRYHTPHSVISFGYPLKATENRCFSCLQEHAAHL